MDEQAYVISDLHIGAGHGDPLEDFTSDDLLSDFLDDIAQPGTTLVINGDFIDFARIEPLSASDVPGDLLWSETASLTKLTTALDGHRQAFAAVSRFLERGGRIRTTVGNHDLDFVWPKVQERFRQAMGGDPNQLAFTTGATNYAGVHIEHGHQFTPENCPRDPSDFIHDWHDRLYLERVWGTDFLLSVFNRLHREHPYADKIKPLSLVAYHAIRNGWIPPSALLNLVLFLKRRGIPFGEIASVVLDETDVSPLHLVGAFEEGPWRELANQVVRANREEISEMIAALDESDRAALRLPITIDVEAEVELSHERAETLGIFRDSREVRGARDRLSQPGVTSVVFGHTHEVIDGGPDGTHFNPGCWIPNLNLRSEDVRAQVRARGFTREVLSDANLYRTELRAVLIRAGPHRSHAELIDVRGTSN